MLQSEGCKESNTTERLNKKKNRMLKKQKKRRHLRDRHLGIAPHMTVCLPPCLISPDLMPFKGMRR